MIILSEYSDTEQRGASQKIARNRLSIPVGIGNLAGFLHMPPDMSKAGIAVLICPPLSRDALNAYHSLRVLADSFAHSGYPCLRFSYQGTGDSCDLDGADTAEIWQNNVQQAADWLRECTGACQIIIVGLRFGALMAATAAQSRDDVAGLVLLAPVLRGQSYLRQIWIEAQLQQRGIPSLEYGFDFQELHFSPQSVATLSRMDLRKVSGLGGAKIAIFASSASASLAECTTTWASQGCDVQQFQFSPLEPMLHHNLEAGAEPADPASVLAWLIREFPQRPDISTVNPRHTILTPTGCREMPILFGAEEHLFGVLCQPETGPGNACIIFVNSGRDPHHGIARFHVTFARQLAAYGIASFRIDFAGLGDSLCPPGQDDLFSPAFDWNRSADLRNAANTLSQFGYEEFSIYGLCAGAYHALQAALTDSRFTSLLLLNLPFLEWRNGDTIDFAKHRILSSNHYLALLVQSGFWRRLFAGQLNVPLILRARLSRLKESFAKSILPWQRPAIAPAGDKIMKQLSARGTKIQLLYAPDDLGLQEIDRHFGIGAPGLNNYPGATLTIIPGIDHMLSNLPQQQIAIAAMLESLKLGPVVI